MVGCDIGYITLDSPYFALGQQCSFDSFTRLKDPYAVTRYKIHADGWISSLNSLEDMSGEKLHALGGNKNIRLMDWSTLFQIGSQK